MALLPPVITALLGPTNTGKTHYAVERMLGRESGVIGLPLRLLAREVYDRICKLKDPRLCALITGEEKIVPPGACYFVCTVEAMPQDRRFACVVIDEAQLAAHPERGHVFTDRLLHMRGYEETLILGAETLRPLVRVLIPEAKHMTRERFSTLTYTGAMKVTRLPKRSVVVAFTASEVYALAELLRRHRGGAAVVMGALSPRTRNAQAQLYQSGEVDFLVATDAVGMGLNLDADHVAFANLRKFDGNRRRFLTPMETAQIAGRAGRFRTNGTFGTTAGCPEMDDDLIGRIENNMFEPLHQLEWRSTKLDFSSVEGLLNSLAKTSGYRELRRTAPCEDELTFEKLSLDPEIISNPKDSRAVKALWETCQIPDFRSLGLDPHVRLVSAVHKERLKGGGKIADDWIERRIAQVDHTDGAIDTLSSRLAYVRTWTFIANKISWLGDAMHWQERTRAVEDRLSDALHERLTQKFVDRRTRALMHGLGRKDSMDVKIGSDGKVTADGHYIGQLDGLKFTLDGSADGAEAKTLRETAEAVVSPEVNRRMASMLGAQHDVFKLSNDGVISWGEHNIARLRPGPDMLVPGIEIIGGLLAQPSYIDHLKARLADYIQTEVRNKLEPLIKLEEATTSKEVSAEARGFAFRLLENDGIMARRGNEQIIRDVPPQARKDLRSVNVRFGEFFIFIPDMLKPAPATLLSILFANSDRGEGPAFVPFAGVTSIPKDGEHSEATLNRAGYSEKGGRYIRLDILNRLGETIRQARNEANSPRFQIALEMMALLGCTYEELCEVLRGLGFKTTKAEPGDIMRNAAEDSSTAPAELAAPGKTAAATSFDEAGQRPETGRAAAAESFDEAVTRTAEAKQKSKSKSQKALTWYEPVIGEDDEGNPIRGHQEEAWYFAKSRGNPQSGKARPRRDGQKGGFKGKPNKGQKGSKGRKPRENYGSYKAKERPNKLEDSPFAALAALKNPKKD